MSSDQYIYSTFDAGDVAIFDDNVYVKQGWVQRKPDKSWKTTDCIDIKGMTFTFDDNNVLNGPKHRSWFPIEMALSNLTKFTTMQWNNPTLFNNSILSPVFQNNAILSKDILFECKADGIARVMIRSTLASDMTIQIFINDVKVDFLLKANAKMNDANAFKVLTGDVIRVPDRYFRVILLPYDYTN